MFSKLNVSLILTSAVFGTVTSSWTDGINSMPWAAASRRRHGLRRRRRRRSRADARRSPHWWHWGPQAREGIESVVEKLWGGIES